jgi:catechol 2,3-dioxygenase-like lactoylglutathione lyase family enzyme
MYEAVDNIGVAVADLDSALEFYETLGFECERYSDSDGRVVPAEETYFYLFETTSENPVERDGDLGDNPVGIDHLSIRVEDVDQTYESLVDTGVDFFSPPTTEDDWGLRLAGTRDPSGNIVYFIEYV